MGLRVEVSQVMNSARTSLATLIPPSAASTVTLFEAESMFEPTAESTLCDGQTSCPYSRKHPAAAMAQATGSRHSSIIYIKSDENPPNAVTSADHDGLPTLAPPAAKLPALHRKSSTPESQNRLTVQSGGLRPLRLLKDRDTNNLKEGDAFKSAGTRPLLVLGNKKQKVTVTRDENAAPNSVNKYLKPLQLRRSESSRMRGILRRDEILPTVVVRPPSTNAKIESPYEQ